ncbi:RNA polymerase sigma factor [bacterium]|nr:RNA polymerase sigma factor [bacterium]
MASQQELTDARNERFLALLKPVDTDCQRWAYSLTQDKEDADDVYAQSVLIGLEHIHQLKNEAAFKTWMFRIIANVHRLMIRQRKRQPDPLEQEKLDRVAPASEDWTEQTHLRAMVKRLLEMLSPDQRQALVLFEQHGLSIREVSTVMGKRETAVRVLLHRARQRMAELLKKEGIESMLPSEGS